MPSHRFRIVNVFAESALAGNPLCVFEDASGLDDATMQALALQFNLSETTFILPSSRATARVRIFTPTFEMPFAGHPTLGSAHVVRDLMRTSDSITLEMIAGVIPVAARGDVWTLVANPPAWRAPEIDRRGLATMLRISPDDVGGPALWVDAGSEQLIVPLNTIDALKRADPDGGTIASWPRSKTGRAMCYVWARESERAAVARFFFTKHTSIIEDPGTGSACANLGGWMLATGQPLPVELDVSQGTAVGRPCRLRLSVGSDRVVRVGGRCVVLGTGSVGL